MSKSARKIRSGSKFQKKKMPFAKRKIDDVQNKRIIKVEQKVTALAKQSEVKHRDVFVNNVAADDVPGTTQMILLNGIPQGTTVDGNTVRTGDQVRLTSLQIRGTWDLNQNTNVGSILRMIIFWDHQAKGAAATVDEVLDAATITDYEYAPYEFENVKYIKVIYDKTTYVHPMVQATQSDTNETPPTDNTITTTLFGSVRHPFKIYKKLNKQIYMGLAAAGDITAIAGPSLYCLFLSSTPVGSNPPNITFGARVYFKDS